MRTLQENNYKRIFLETRTPLSKEAFEMDGVGDLKVKENTVGFIFKGNINAMMKKLSDFELRNISIEEPDLEEIFMHYHAKEA